ncbi:MULTISPECIES: hypothetical protein [Ehrlichia]|uniref:Uncharacterized protein n=1 Tax=Ehrlichia cf. muris str. EmCRT TaxID=1359167 RepID=A0A0F3NDP6_9RICK|nr:MULTISPECIES: hypothetical protein [Ehrlichia]KJV65837.1 hypothetical protein EMUCRT_0017 [Ehrlichia cf. muris str. EmCRT]OUC04315.1 hypothetical protein DB91_03030 [Ehrlichia sp. Wisconsin_h]
MLTQLRNSFQRFTTPSFIKALGSFNVSQFRNTQYVDCTSGHAAWKDLPRNQIVINGQDAKFSQVVNANETLKDKEYRKTLHEILALKFQEISNQNISGPLIDECVTMINQASLYGSSLELLQLLGKDIQARMHLNSPIVPAMDTFETKIEIISESNLALVHTEQLTFRGVKNGTPISTVNTTLYLDITSKEDIITYSNSKISLEIPQNVASRVFSINTIRLSNMFAPISNAIHRIRAFCTGTPFQKVTPYKITRNHNTLIIGHSLPNYKCSPVTIPDIENQKEKHKQKQKSQYQTRSTFIRPHPSEEDIRKPTGNSNKDSKQQQNKPLNVSAEIHETKIQPQTESRSL